MLTRCHPVRVRRRGASASSAFARVLGLVLLLVLAPLSCGDRSGDLDDDGALDSDDCAPLDPDIYPGAPEVCDNGLDDDCNQLTDVADPACCGDRDGDGFVGSCESGNDCDDLNSLVYPGAPEDCLDEVDSDCDGSSGADEPDCCTDDDGDGYGQGEGCLDDDCDDEDPAAWPGAPDPWDDGSLSSDTDCDGVDGVDADGDGSPGNAPEDHATFDCDDEDDALGPHAAEICGDAVDEDCDGAALLPDEEAAASWLDFRVLPPLLRGLAAISYPGDCDVTCFSNVQYDFCLTEYQVFGRFALQEEEFDSFRADYAPDDQLVVGPGCFPELVLTVVRSEPVVAWFWELPSAAAPVADWLAVGDPVTVASGSPQSFLPPMSTLNSSRSVVLVIEPGETFECSMEPAYQLTWRGW